MRVANVDGVIYGEQNFMIPAHLNCGKFVIDRMWMCKEEIALIDGTTGDQMTFGVLVQRTVNTASGLMRAGVKRGEVIGICCENRMEFFVAVIGAWCVGATVTLLNAAYNKNDMVYCMNISKPKYVFLSPDAYTKYYEIMVETKFVEEFYIFGDSITDPKLKSFEDLMKVHVDVDSFEIPMDINGKGWNESAFINDADLTGLAQTALILYSSGTTGPSKGAKLTHLNILTTGCQPYNTSKNKLRCLTVVPWCNTIGTVCTLDELINQRTVIYLTGFKEEQYLSCIEKYKAGMLLAVPPLIVMLTKSPNVQNYDVSSVEVIYCGGAPLKASVIKAAKQSFPNLAHALQIYGMTESSGAITETTVIDSKPGSVGKVIQGLIAKIVDVETRQILGPHQQGEVCIKGPALFGGYIDKDMSDYLDEDGFFKTGDVCYYDEDGYFFYVDRYKELIKYKAGQVSPSELEAILLQHPAVRDAAVIGKPDNVAGELPTAFVVKKPGEAVTANELIDFVAAEVSSWKQLRGGVYFIDEIPKNPSGKILKRILRDYMRNAILQN